MPPQNAAYMYAAYAAAGIIYAAYAISIWWRARKVAQRQRMALEAPAAHAEY